MHCAGWQSYFSGETAAKQHTNKEETKKSGHKKFKLTGGAKNTQQDQKELSDFQETKSDRKTQSLTKTDLTELSNTESKLQIHLKIFEIVEHYSTPLKFSLTIQEISTPAIDEILVDDDAESSLGDPENNLFYLPDEMPVKHSLISRGIIERVNPPSPVTNSFFITWTSIIKDSQNSIVTYKNCARTVTVALTGISLPLNLGAPAAIEIIKDVIQSYEKHFNKADLDQLFCFEDSVHIICGYNRYLPLKANSTISNGDTLWVSGSMISFMTKEFQETVKLVEENIKSRGFTSFDLIH